MPKTRLVLLNKLKESLLLIEVQTSVLVSQLDASLYSAHHSSYNFQSKFLLQSRTRILNINGNFKLHRVLNVNSFEVHKSIASKIKAQFFCTILNTFHIPHERNLLLETMMNTIN